MKYTNVLISYPKSGRTWLWAAACHAISHEYGIPLENQGKDKLFAAAGIPLASSTHDYVTSGHEKLTANLFWLYRHPLDILVSNYHWRFKTGGVFNFAWEEAKQLGIYMSGWWHDQKRPKLRLSYEKLHTDFHDSLYFFLEWLGADCGPCALNHAYEQSRFDVMQQDNNIKCRKGIIGDWKNHFNANQVRLLWRVLEHYPCELLEEYR